MKPVALRQNQPAMDRAAADILKDHNPSSFTLLLFRLNFPKALNQHETETVVVNIFIRNI